MSGFACLPDAVLSSVFCCRSLAVKDKMHCEQVCTGWQNVLRCIHAVLKTSGLLGSASVFTRTTRRSTPPGTAILLRLWLCLNLATLAHTDMALAAWLEQRATGIKHVSLHADSASPQAPLERLISALHHSSKEVSRRPTMEIHTCEACTSYVTAEQLL